MKRKRVSRLREMKAISKWSTKSRCVVIEKKEVLFLVEEREIQVAFMQGIFRHLSLYLYTHTPGSNIFHQTVLYL